MHVERRRGGVAVKVEATWPMALVAILGRGSVERHVRAGPPYDEIHHVEDDILVLGYISSEVIERTEDLVSWSAFCERLLYDGTQSHCQLVVRRRGLQGLSLSF